MMWRFVVMCQGVVVEMFEREPSAEWVQRFADLYGEVEVCEVVQGRVEGRQLGLWGEA